MPSAPLLVLFATALSTPAGLPEPGSARLDLVAEPQRLLLRLSLPQASLVDFDGAPRDEAERAAAADALARLADAARLLQVDPAAGCGAAHVAVDYGPLAAAAPTSTPTPTPTPGANDPSSASGAPAVPRTSTAPAASAALPASPASPALPASSASSASSAPSRPPAPPASTASTASTAPALSPASPAAPAWPAASASLAPTPEAAAAVVAHYAFDCTAADAAAFIEAPLLQHFPRLRLVHVTLATARGPDKALLSRPLTRVPLR